MEFKNVDNFESWYKWKDTLAKAIHLGKGIGMSEETIDKIAFRIGDFLAAGVDPENREHRLLKELWEVGNKEDQKVIAKLIVKMVENTEKH